VARLAVCGVWVDTSGKDGGCSMRSDECVGVTSLDLNEWLFLRHSKFLKGGPYITPKSPSRLSSQTSETRLPPFSSQPKKIVPRPKICSKVKSKAKRKSKIQNGKTLEPQRWNGTQANKDSNDFFHHWQHTCGLGTAT
jgi:hypothetical protein